LTSLILGIDAGNYKAKVAGPYGVDSFKTNICGWFEIDQEDTFNKSEDMEYEIDGRKGYAGPIAEREDQFSNGTIYGETKAHLETKIRTLLAIHRYLEKYSIDADTFNIVTGQPISNHKEEEKNKIINMLRGEHRYVVNGKKRKITIDDVKVSPEGTGAFWSDAKAGTVRIIDIGSGTVNAVSMLDKKHLHKASGTMDTGMETLKDKTDLETMARGIIQYTTKLKWKPADTVLICGGAAEALEKHIQRHYLNACTLSPQLKREHDVLSTKPVYANAVGFYNLAKVVYA
jgi:plasmid segregation protein ParM